MNERIRELAEQAGFLNKDEESIGYFAELIVKKCAAIASNTNLEDVDGGDSAVLGAAREQILEHFGVEQ